MALASAAIVAEKKAMAAAAWHGGMASINGVSAMTFGVISKNRYMAARLSAAKRRKHQSKA